MQSKTQAIVRGSLSNIGHITCRGSLRSARPTSNTYMQPASLKSFAEVFFQEIQRPLCDELVSGFREMKIVFKEMLGF